MVVGVNSKSVRPGAEPPQGYRRAAAAGVFAGA
jgi:hypothetical protein